MPDSEAAPRARPAYLRPAAIGLVFVGGALGTALRAWLESRYAGPAGTWPTVTFVINLTGAFALGLLLTWLGLRGPDVGLLRVARLGLGTGVVGGFTTYSTFIVEVDLLLRGGHTALGLAYALGSVGGGLAAALTGVWLAGRLRARPAAGSAEETRS